MELTVYRIPTGADLHHHRALKSPQTVTDEPTGRVLTRTVATHVAGQATLVDVCNTCYTSQS